MTNFILASGTYGVQSLASGEYGIVTQNADVIATGSGIYGLEYSLQVAGGVYASQTGIFVSSGGLSQLNVTQTGIVMSATYAAFSARAPVNFTNAGLVSGITAGVEYYNNTGAMIQLKLVNTGTIQGQMTAIYGAGPSTLNITNHGTILGGNYGIANKYDVVSGTGATTFDITNYGLITGGRDAINLGNQADTLINHGHIIGDVFLGGGADFYNGRGGTVDGVIDGGDGDDGFRLGASEETIIGGAGFDTLDLSRNGAVKLALDGSFANTGIAAGDQFSGIEQVLGSNKGNDYLRGDEGDNKLVGNGGNDKLEGMSGNDTLVGGLGKDTLAGGMGNDSFVFETLQDCGDIILDFRNYLGNNDGFQFVAEGFDGLTVGSLAQSAFRARVDNLAQDADDRFIFRSTDKTLWFDADGNGATAPLMVADLQANAFVTFADIVVI